MRTKRPSGNAKAALQHRAEEAGNGTAAPAPRLTPTRSGVATGIGRVLRTAGQGFGPLGFSANRAVAVVLLSRLPTRACAPFMSRQTWRWH